MPAGWPWLDMSHMNSTAASALSTIITVLLFAFFVELGALMRASANAGRTIRVERGPSVASVFFVGSWLLLVLSAVLFCVTQMPLLAVMNGAHLAAADARVAWVSSLFFFPTVMVGMCAAFIDTALLS